MFFILWPIIEKQVCFFEGSKNPYIDIYWSVYPHLRITEIAESCSLNREYHYKKTRKYIYELEVTKNRFTGKTIRR